VPVQDKVRRRRVGQQGSDLFQALSHFAGQGRGFYFQRGVVFAVNDLADGDLASQCFREHEGVEGHQQPVVLGELIGEDETDGDELGGFPPACG